MTAPAVRYTPPPGLSGGHACTLVVNPGTDGELHCSFQSHVEIGRDDGRPDATGIILVSDPAVSRRHCIVSRRPDGRCVVRDLSLNGTRLDGRRLVPNVEAELRPGQRIAVTEGCELLLESAPLRPPPSEPAMAVEGTMISSALVMATIVVGDIRNFTGLVRAVPPDVLQPSVNRVFARLAETAGHLGGTVKEFQGDALVAFWEGTAHRTRLAEVACRAALELDGLARELATHPTVWQVEGHPLEMDWALATGPVMINAFGGDQPAGLSMIGEPIVLAFRLEKFAGDETGRILACPATRKMAGSAFEFRDLGTRQAKGFDKPDHVFALEGERPQSRRPAEAGAS